MQTKSPFLDEFAQLMTHAMGAAQGVGDEMQAVFRAQAEKFIADMDLVGRDEFEAMKALAQEAIGRAEAAEAKIAALESKLADRKAETARKPAAVRKPAAKKTARKKPT